MLDRTLVSIVDDDEPFRESMRKLVALLGYTAVLALIFHAFWAVDPKQFQAQLNLFLFHAETIGGLLYIAAYGAGVYAGCVRERTLAPVLPVISGQPFEGLRRRRETS